MVQKLDESALYWRSIKSYKVGLIRHAIQNSEGGTLKAAAVYLGISEGGLLKEVRRLKAEGYYVRDSDQKAALEEARKGSSTPESVPDGTGEDTDGASEL